MTINDLRRLKHLSEIPTHSPASLEELKELVRLVTIRAILFSDEADFCKYCAHWGMCGEEYANMNHCEFHKGFELRMEDGSAD